MADSAPTDAELDAAIAAITDPGRLREAQAVVIRTAPALQRVLAAALEEGGWFEPAQHQAVLEATAQEDPAERARAVRTMLAEETRLGMLVGVAVGFELARELGSTAPARPGEKPVADSEQRPGEAPVADSEQRPGETPNRSSKQRQED